jgi:hypothetical protein
LRESKCVLCGFKLDEIRGLAYKKYQNKYAHWDCYDFLKEKSKMVHANGKPYGITAILKLLDEFNIPRDLIYHKSHERRNGK